MMNDLSILISQHWYLKLMFYTKIFYIFINRLRFSYEPTIKVFEQTVRNRDRRCYRRGECSVCVRIFLGNHVMYPDYSPKCILISFNNLWMFVTFLSSSSDSTACHKSSLWMFALLNPEICGRKWSMTLKEMSARICFLQNFLLFEI